MRDLQGMRIYAPMIVPRLDTVIDEAMTIGRQSTADLAVKFLMREADIWNARGRMDAGRRP